MPRPGWEPPVLAPYLRQHGELEPVQDEPEFSDPVEHEESPGPKSKIGIDELEREVYYDPDFNQGKLANAHLVITGESGSGKTQSMKTIMADLNDQHVPALVLDFKDDYSDPLYAEKEDFRVFDPTKTPLPINPLAPPTGADGSVNPTFHSYQLGEIVSRIYRLGDIQGYKLREAIKGVYGDAGIPMTSHRPSANIEWPSFQSVKDKLALDKDNSELIGHMSPIFDFGLFSGTDSKLGGLGGVATSNTVIRLGQLPGNEVKNNVAEFFLMALYNHLIRQPQTSQLQQILVLDEAWRLVQSPFLEPLMRESRAFGLGIFVATQFPTDLPQTVSGNAATKLFFGQSSPTQINEIGRTISGKPYGTPLSDQVQYAVRDLKPLHCIVVNKQYEPFVSVAAEPYYARTEETPMRELPQPTAGRNFNQSKGDTHRTRKAQSDGTPEYICPRCQAPVANPGQTCDNCMKLVDTFDNTLSSESDQASINERIDQAANQGQADHSGTDPTRYWDAGSKTGQASEVCSACGGTKTSEHVMQAQCYRCGGMGCGECDGLGTVQTEWKSDCGVCKGTGVKPKTAELQPFPPGEGEDDGNPFAPFSMSEWQMVKGPKLKPRGGSSET